MRLFWVVPSLVLCSQVANTAVPQQKPEMPGIAFEANTGQAGDPQVRFLARTRQATVFLTDRETVFLMRRDGAPKQRTATLRMTLAGAGARRLAPPTVPGGPMAKPSLFVDSWVGAQEQWRQSIPAYERVIRRDVYPGIDAVFRGTPNRREIEYDFVVHTGASPSQISMRFDGAKSLRIVPDGDLHIETAEGTLVHRKPVVTQNGGREIPARFRLTGKYEVGFELLAAYDPSADLIIDPVVTFARFYGGSGEDVVTAAGGPGFGGYTNSAVFPGSGSAPSGGYDAFFVSLANTPRIAYIGGSGDDRAFAVSSVNSTTAQGEFVDFAMGGDTDSPDFPRLVANGTNGILTPENSPSTFKPRGGRKDAFLMVTNVNNVRSPNIHAFGGSGDDRILAVSHIQGGVLFAGETDSPDLPVETFAYQSTHGGGRDGFFGWLNSSAFTPTLSYWGGSGDDRLTAAGAGYLAGSTDSDDLQLSNAMQSKRAGGRDGVLLYAGNTQFQSVQQPQTAPLLATYFGGSGDDEISAVTAYQSMVAVAGSTGSRDLAPAGTTASGAHQPTHAGGDSDGFIATFRVPLWSTTGTALTSPVPAAFTYVGGSGSDRLTGILSFNARQLFVSGVTTSQDLKLADPVQAAYGGGAGDALFGGFHAASLEAFVLTYAGGSGTDSGAGVGTDRNGQIFLAGTTDSESFPGVELTPERGGRSEAFVLGFANTRLAVSVSQYACKDCTAFIQLPATRLASGTARLRVRSLDPSRLVFAHGIRNSAPEVEFTWAGELRNIVLGVLADNGQPEVSIEVEGFPEVRERITLTPAYHYLEASGFSIGLQPRVRGSGTVVVGQNGAQLFWTVVGRTPEGVEYAANFPRPGIGSPELSYLISDPTVARIPPGGAAIVPIAAGTSRVTLNIRGLSVAVPAPTFDVTVLSEAPVRIENVQLQPVSGFLTPLGAVSPAVTYRSLDLAAGWLYDGSKLVEEARAAGLVWALGGPAGSTMQLEVRIGKQEPIRISAPVEAPYFGFTASRLTMTEGVIGAAGFRTGTRSSFEQLSQATLSSFRGVTFRIESSDPSVLEVLTPVITSSMREPAAAQVRPLRPGRAEIRLFGPDGLIPFPGSDTVAVTVNAAPPVPPVPPASVVVPVFPSFIGKDLQAAAYAFTSPTTTTTPVSITVTSSDPARLVISRDSATPGSASQTVAPNAAIWLQALADSGEVTVTLAAEGYASSEKRLRLVPSGVALQPSSDQVVTVLGADVPLRYAFYATPPGAVWITEPGANVFTSNLTQIQRPGVDPSVRILNRNPEVGTLVSGSIVQARNFHPIAPGTAVLELESAAFRTLPGSSRFRISVRAAQVPLYPVAVDQLLGKDTFAVLVSALSGRNPDSRMRVSSSDSSKVALMSSTADSPAPALDIQAGSNFYIAGMDSSGSATIRIDSEHAPPQQFEVQLAPSYFWLRPPGGITRELLYTSNTQPFYSLEAAIAIVNPDFLAAPQVTIRPGVRVTIPIRSSNTAVASLNTGNLILGDPQNSVTAAVVSAGVAGTAVVEIEPPPGYDGGPPESRRVTVRSLPRQPTLRDATIPRDTQVLLFLSDDVPGPVTFTSSDPSRLLLAIPSQSNSATAGGPGQASITIQTGQKAFLAQALADSGEVFIEARGEDMLPARSSVRLTPLQFGLEQPQAEEQPTVSGAERRFSVFPIPPADVREVYYRTGAPSVTLTLESSDPAVARVLTPEIRYPETNSFRVEAGPTPGVVSLSLKPGPGAGTAGELSQRILEVAQPAISIQGPVALGMDRMVTRYASFHNPTSRPVEITIRSTDPSRVLVSVDTLRTGEREIRINSTGSTSFAIQAVGSPGTVEVVLEGPGLVPAVLEVRIVRSSIVFTSRLTDLRVEGPSPVFFGLAMTGVDPVTGQLLDGNIRPGVEVEVQISNSNPSAGILEGLPLRLTSTSGQVRFVPQPAGGSTTLRIIQPPGYLPSPSGDTVTVTVIGTLKQFQWQRRGPAVFRTQYPTSLTFPAGLPPAGTQATVTTLSPGALQVGKCDLAGPATSTQIDATSGFCVYPLIDNGTARVRIEIPGYVAVEENVELWPAGLIFSPEAPSVPNGSSVILRVSVAGLHPTTLAPTLSGFSLAPSFRSTLASLAVSDATVARLSSTSAALGERGAAEFELTALKIGVTSVSVGVPNGFRRPASSAVSQVTVTAPVAATGTIALVNGQVAPTGMGTTIRFTMNPPALSSTQVTITAADANLAQVASSRSGTFQTSVSVPGGAESNVHVSVMNNVTGAITLRVSAPGYIATTFTLPVFQGAAGFNAASIPLTLGSLGQATLALGYVANATAPLQISLQSFLPPGTTFEIRSDSTQVARIVGSNLAVFESGAVSSTVQVEGMARGTTQLRFDPPAAFPARDGLSTVLVIVQ
jgi:hypothetical protein